MVKGHWLPGQWGVLANKKPSEEVGSWAQGPPLQAAELASQQMVHIGGVEHRKPAEKPRSQPR